MEPELPPCPLFVSAEAERDKALALYGRLRQSEQQRDELLAMLKQVVDAEFEFGSWPTQDELRALIAKVEDSK